MFWIYYRSGNHVIYERAIGETGVLPEWLLRYFEWHAEMRVRELKMRGLDAWLTRERLFGALA